jgi:hypothetical protein
MLVCVVGGSEGFFAKSSAHRRLAAGSLTDLEAVTLVGFKGHDQEVDFLKVRFRCTTVLKSMTVSEGS